MSVLSSEQRSFLSREGYLVIPDCLDQRQLDLIRNRLDEIEKEEGHGVGSPHPTYWQSRLSASACLSHRLLSVIYTFVFKVVKAAAHRWVFRFAPHFLDRLQRMNGRRPVPEASWRAIYTEFLAMLHVAAMEEPGVVRMTNLVNKGSVFDVCLAEPRVLAAVGQVIATDFKLSSLNCRAVEPGGGLQWLHIDWEQARPERQVAACNTIWMLDDLTTENGATRVVPGSQFNPLTPSEALADRLAAHPDERLICAPAGSVAIMNGQVWHGGTRNRTPRRRRVLQGYFVGLAVNPQLDQEAFATEATVARLTQAERSVLGLSEAAVRPDVQARSSP